MIYRVQFDKPKKLLYSIFLLGFFWIVLRFVKWLPNVLTLAKYIDYLYYLPIVVLPTLFFVFCIETFHATLKGKKRIYAILFLICSVFVILALTNDLHQLIYKNYTFGVNEKGVAVARLATYSYGIVHYFAMGYDFLLTLSALAIVLIGAKLSPIQGVLSSTVILLAITYFVLYALGVPFTREVFFIKDLALVSIFFIQSGIEIMLDLGLVRNNGRYVVNFTRSALPMCIYDENSKPLYKSEKFKQIIADDEKETVRVSSKKIGEYTVISQADVSEMINLKKKTQAESDELSKTKQLLEDALKVAKEEASLTYRLSLLEEIESSIGKSRDEMAKLVETLPAVITDENSKESKRTLGRIALKLGYMKQKCMLLLGAKERKALTSEEFKMLLNVISHDVQSVGFKDIAVALTSDSDVDFSLAVQVNEFINAVAEGYEFLDLNALILVNQIKKVCSIELEGVIPTEKPIFVVGNNITCRVTDSGLRYGMEVERG